MAVIEEPTKSEKTDKESIGSGMLNTAIEYASSTTINGCSFIANIQHPIVSRIFWLLVVILGFSVTTFQVVSLYYQWETNPVVTNLETISLPIEDIKFPAVTICPQGSVKDVVDNVMLHQLKEYVRKKEQTLRSKRSTSQNKNSLPKENPKQVWNVTYEEMLVQIKEFMNEVYPGAKDIPTEFVTLMASDDPHKVVQNEAVVLPVKDEECNETSNRENVDTLNKQLNNDFCPDGFTKFDNIGCVLVAQSEMTYEEASDYCTNMDGASVFQLDSFDDIKNLDEHNIIGINIIKIVTYSSQIFLINFLLITINLNLIPNIQIP
jgi:hypothetical protein